MTANEAMERSKDPRRKVASVGDEEAIEALVAEIERLRAIVDKLPKTADGVPAVPGMELFCDSERVCSYHKYDVAAGRLPRYAFSPLVGMVCEGGMAHYAEVPICHCYSNREALNHD